MSNELDGYRRELLSGLRKYDVPGARIAQAIAEVESHVADTGEDPRTAFGEPQAYAAALSRSLNVRQHRFLPGRPRWVGPLLAAAAFATGGLTVTWMRHGLRRADSMEVAWTTAGLAVLWAGLIWLAVHLHRRLRLVDPRSGDELRIPAPRQVGTAVTIVASFAAVAAVAALVVDLAQ